MKIEAFSLDKRSSHALYRQIAGQIMSMIREGRLAPGERLPTYRELAQRFKIAPGTVRKAYEELAREGWVHQVQGSGTFVGDQAAGTISGRKEQAHRLIAELLTSLEALRFSYSDMRDMILLRIRDREERQNQFSIALVDCNPETLRVCGNQLQALSHGTVRGYLLDDLRRSMDPPAMLGPFDLIVTTSTHAQEVGELLPGLERKICRAAVSLSCESVIAFASFSPAQSPGVFCESERFFRIVARRLEELRLWHGGLEVLYVSETDRLSEFLINKNVLIVPTGFTPAPSVARVLRDFTERGGRLLTFEYRIEQGSLLYLQDRITALREAHETDVEAP